MYEIVYISDKDNTGIKFCNIPDIFKLLTAPLPHSYIIPTINNVTSSIIDKLKIECLKYDLCYKIEPAKDYVTITVDSANTGYFY